MSQSGLLKATALVLDRLGVHFMLSGSFASSLQGEPRATHDIDLVVDLAADHVEAILKAFPPPAYYLSRDAIEEALRTKGMFNLLEAQEGDKVDFWILTDEPFDRSRFARRQSLDLDGVSVTVSAPEDTILMKLKWARDAGGSERQHRDALRVYEVQRGALDLTYLEQWVGNLGLSDEWRILLEDAEPME